MRIVFMGTPDFAVPSLRTIIEQGYNVIAVVTQPDRPKGRHGSIMLPSPVKEVALENGLIVLQPERAKAAEFIEQIRTLSPDVIVTAAYGQILKKELLEIPKHGCINVHGSLLPKYRGPAPIQWAMINGENETGITTMLTDVGIDTGDILLMEPTLIFDDESVNELHDRLSLIGARLLIRTLEGIINGTIEPIPQKHEESSYAPMLKKEMGIIQWCKTAVQIKNLVRGMNPWPGTFTFYKQRRLRIHAVTVVDILPNDISANYICRAYQSGEIVRADKEGLIVATGDNFIQIDELQEDGGKRMKAELYLAGHSLLNGDILGEV